MRTRRENLIDRIRDAASGYAVIILSIICFILALAAIIATVRLFGGIR